MSRCGKEFKMATTNCNIIEINGKIYTIAERVREESDVREIPYTINEYVKEVENGEICRDPLIQRTEDQWSKKQKSKLIESILHNRPIGNIVLAKGRAESKSYSITSLVDGLQRSTAIVDFYNDNFSIDKNAKPILCRFIDNDGNAIKHEYEIAGKKFSQLPDSIKSFFNKYRLTIHMYEGFDDEELDDVVLCMNNGKQPNAYQRIRFLLGSENMAYIQPICDSTVFEDVKGCKDKNDSILATVVRTLMMMTDYEYKNLGSATMTKFVNDFDEYVKMKTINKLSSLFEQFEETKEDFTDNELENLTNVTVPNYIIALDKFNSVEHGDVTYIDVLRKFWEDEEFTNFSNACDTEISGMSLFSYENIQDRQYAINDFIDKYFSAENVQADSVIQNEMGNDCMTGTNHTEYSETNHNNEIADFHDNEKNYVQATIPLSYNGYVQSRL